jgi:hypothetical protein
MIPCLKFKGRRWKKISEIGNENFPTMILNQVQLPSDHSIDGLLDNTPYDISLVQCCILVNAVNFSHFLVGPINL